MMQYNTTDTSAMRIGMGPLPGVNAPVSHHHLLGGGSGFEQLIPCKHTRATGSETPVAFVRPAVHIAIRDIT